MYTKYHDEITIQLTGAADKHCFIHVMKQNSTTTRFFDHPCYVSDDAIGNSGAKTALSKCAALCNQKVQFTLQSGKSKQYIRLIEDSVIKMMEIPIGN